MPFPSHFSGRVMDNPPFCTLALTSPLQSLMEMPPFWASTLSVPVLWFSDMPPFVVCACAVPANLRREMPPLRSERMVNGWLGTLAVDSSRKTEPKSEEETRRRSLQSSLDDLSSELTLME